jgi:nucleoside-diphosphate-sugar epimerase
VIGVDLAAPPAEHPCRIFAALDLGEEESCRDLLLLLREFRPIAVVHLAFAMEQSKTEAADTDRMWQVNVAGTARVLEAISEANRDGPIVQKFIFPSSVAVYGTPLRVPVTEDAPLGAHTLPYALHKMECDKVVRQRAPALQGCSVYMLRPHLFAGANARNYLVGAFRGTPDGPSPRAARMRQAGKRLPCLLPVGQRYLSHRTQFVHVDDVARLIVHILRKPEPEAQRLTLLNLAGRGEPLTFLRCAEIAQARLRRVPGIWTLRLILALLWRFGISSTPPEAAPYLIGEYVMNTERLQKFLGADYETVIRYQVADAFRECFPTEGEASSQSQVSA